MRPHGVYPLVFLFSLFVLAAVPGAHAQRISSAGSSSSFLAVDDSLPIALGVDYRDFKSNLFLNNDILVSGTVWAVAEMPKHGSLEFQTDGFRYSPGPSFWDLGLDTVIYSIQAPGGEIKFATIYIYPGEELELVYEEVFEDDSFLEYFFTSGEVSFRRTDSSAEMIGGNGALEISVYGDGEAYVQVPGNAGDPGQTAGSNSDSGRTSGMIDDSGEITHGFVSARTVLMKLGRDDFGPVDTTVQLVYTWNGTERLVMAEVWDQPTASFVSTEPVTLISDTPEVELTWYRIGDTVGVWVSADGSMAGPAKGTNPLAEFDTVRFGVMPQQAVPQTVFGLDDLRVWRQIPGRNLDPYSPLVFENNFEKGKPGSQSTYVGSGIGIRSEGAITGENGLLVDLLAGDSYMRTDWVGEEEALTMQFQVDISKLSMAAGEMFTFLSSGVGANFGDLSLRLYLANIQGVMHFAAHAYRDQGQPKSIGWLPVSGSFEVRLRMRTSNGIWGDNGFLQVWLDGQRYGTFKLKNETRSLGWSQLGAHGVDTFTSGSISFDDLVIWK